MTYDVHEREEVGLDAGLAMVTHHHLIRHHQGLHVALRADAAHPLPAVVGQIFGILKLLLHVLCKREIADRLPPLGFGLRYWNSEEEKTQKKWNNDSINVWGRDTSYNMENKCHNFGEKFDRHMHTVKPRPEAHMNMILFEVFLKNIHLIPQ